MNTVYCLWSWSFQGMPVAQCVQILKRQCRVIKTVQAMYSEAVSVSAIKKLALFLPTKLLDVFNNNSETEDCIVGNVATCLNCCRISLSMFYHIWHSLSISRHQETCLILVDWLFFCICQNPLAMDLVLNLPNDGIRLVFDPVMQRLKVLIYFNLFLFICYFHNHTYSTPPCV